MTQTSNRPSGAAPDPSPRTATDLPDRMLAVTACGPGFENVQVRAVPVPRPGPRQILARVDAAGVCTSNLKLIAQGADHPFLNGWDMQRWPIILGDEGCITLVEIGPDLRQQFRPGERYVVQPAVDCGPLLHRERYRNNGEGMHKCAVGYSLPGHLAQYILVQEEVLAAECLVPLPDPELPFFASSMAEPISCVVSAQERHVHIMKDGPHDPRRPHVGLLPGGVTIVRGAGAMGRMHAELALRFRPRLLIVADRSAEKRSRTQSAIGRKAREAGTRLLCIHADEIEEILQRETGGEGADDYILALGVRGEHQRALGLLAPGGVADLFGGLPKGEHLLQLNSVDVHYREVRVVGSSGGEPSDMAATLRAVSDGEIDPGNYVAAVGSLDNAVTVLERIRDRRIDGRAILYPHIAPTPLRDVETWSAKAERDFLSAQHP